MVLRAAVRLVRMSESSKVWCGLNETVIAKVPTAERGMRCRDVSSPTQCALQFLHRLHCSNSPRRHDLVMLNPSVVVQSATIAAAPCQHCRAAWGTGLREGGERLGWQARHSGRACIRPLMCSSVANAPSSTRRCSSRSRSSRGSTCHAAGSTPCNICWAISAGAVRDPRRGNARDPQSGLVPGCNS